MTASREENIEDNTLTKNSAAHYITINNNSSTDIRTIPNQTDIQTDKQTDSQSDLLPSVPLRTKRQQPTDNSYCDVPRVRITPE